MLRSSREFATSLKPEATLRRNVLLCGCVTAVTGTLIILAMPLSLIPRLLLALAWLGESLRELIGLWCGAARLGELRLDADGNLSGVRRDGTVEPLELLYGSVVLGRVAWLRLRFRDGLKHGELLRRTECGDLEWQRLELIWRHRRGAFGPQGGS